MRSEACPAFLKFFEGAEMILLNKGVKEKNCFGINYNQGRKRPLDTPKKMIERREREKGRRRDIEREGEIRQKVFD